MLQQFACKTVEPFPRYSRFRNATRSLSLQVLTVSPLLNWNWNVNIMAQILNFYISHFRPVLSQTTNFGGKTFTKSGNLTTLWYVQTVFTYLIDSCCPMIWDFVSQITRFIDHSHLYQSPILLEGTELSPATHPGGPTLYVLIGTIALAPM